MSDPDPSRSFPARLVESWPAVVSSLTPPRRAALAELLTGSDPPARRLALLRKLLLTGIPRDDAVWKRLFGSEVGVRYVAPTAAEESSWWTLAELAVSLRPSSPDAQPPERPAQPPADAPAGPEPPAVPPLSGNRRDPVPTWRELHRQVREALAGVSALVPEQSRRPEVADERHLVRLRYGRDDVRIPSFQVDRAGHPLRVVLEVNRLLGADRDPWAVACWWLDRHAWLQAAPVELLGVRDGDLLAAVRSVEED